MASDVVIVFVYEHKNTGEIRVRWLDDAEILENDESWSHIGTLDPGAYIQGLLREYPALVRKLKDAVSMSTI